MTTTEREVERGGTGCPGMYQRKGGSKGGQREVGRGETPRNGIKRKVN
jgi:hypothetical protein